MIPVVCQADLARWGTVEIVASVRLGRTAPLATSEASYADPGDAGEVELADVRAQDEHGREVSILGNALAPSLLTDDERRACELAARESAEAPLGLGD